MRSPVTRCFAHHSAAAMAGVALGLLALALALASAAPSRAAGQDVASGAERSPRSSLDLRSAHPSPGDFEGLRAQAAKRGMVRVIVGLRASFTAEGQLDKREVDAQRHQLDQRGDDVLAALGDSQYRVVHRYKTLPYLALEVSADALDALRRAGVAASVQKDAMLSPALEQSGTRVEATEAASLARSGNGQHVAIIDTGVDKNHELMQQSGTSKVVAEACFSSSGHCLGGRTSSTRYGSGQPCSFDVTGCQHGTKVAAIAAGRHPSGLAGSGVARAARLIAINVASRTSAGTATFAMSDIIKGLEHVYTLRGQHSIAAVNLSAGEGLYTSFCDTSQAAWKTAIDNLASVGIATIAASMNDGFKRGVSAPACVSSAIAVGATDTDTDTVATFSNSGPQLDLLAPGTDIAVRGFESGSGTSLAAPHAAGAFAVLKAVNPGISVSSGLSLLRETGRPVLDPANAVTAPRIRVLSATVRQKDYGFHGGSVWDDFGVDVTSAGVGLATREGAASSGTLTWTVPNNVTLRAAYLYWATIGGPDDTIRFGNTGLVTGQLIGASRDTCDNINQRGPVRIYRADVTSQLTATSPSGTKTVSGIGDVGDGQPQPDGKGASIVVVYQHDLRALRPRRRVVLHHGAMTVTPGQSMTHSFSVSPAASSDFRARLNVGIADGDSGGEEPMRFNNIPISGSNAFSGTDGPSWDDMSLPILFMPTMPGTYPATLKSTGECLAWAYAALSYNHA